MNVFLLRGLSIGYLLVPNLLFYFYWTRPAVAMVGIILLIYVFIFHFNSRPLVYKQPINGWDWTRISALAIFLTLLSGTSGICWQETDHWCHTTKLHDLYVYDWPLRYLQTGPAFSYYYGYYLVPALLFKVIGGINDVIIFVWTWLGLGLGLAWLYLVLNKKIIYVLLCLCIGDTPGAIRALAKKVGILFYPNDDIEIEMWSITNSLLFAPNQVIPTLIIGGMLVYTLKNKLDIEEITFPIALSLWWAVFPALTGGLLAGILIIREWALNWFHIDWSGAAKRVLLPALSCLPVLFLYTSHQEVPISGLVWTFDVSTSYLLVEYLINIALNLVLFLSTYIFFNKRLSDLPSFPFYLILVLVLIFPIYRIGVYNDFVFRGLMTYTIILALYLLLPFASEHSYMAVVRIARKSLLNFVLLFLLFFSIYNPVRRVKRALEINLITARLFPNSITFEPFPYDAYPSIYEMLKDRYSLQEAKQYLGEKESFYEQYIGNTRPLNH